MTTTTPYGAWPSPLTARSAAADDGMPRWVSARGDAVWWCEPRPAESGRVALVRRVGDGPVETVLPAPWNVRSRVHEYGGRSYLVLPDDAVVFAEYADQRLHLARAGGEPVPISPAPAVASGLRYIEPFLSPDASEVWCIREEHHSEVATDVTRSIVAVPLDGSAATDPARARVVVEDGHFLACPQLSPDGTQLSWLTWDHPQMPWDATLLRVAELGDGIAGQARTVAGGPDESVPQACWLDDSTLLAASDRSGWWNLHRIDLDSGRSESVCPRDEEFAGPLWNLGPRWFGVLDDGRVATLHGVGAMRLGLLDPSTGVLGDVESPFTEWSGQLHLADGRVLAVAGASDRPFQVVAFDPATSQTTVVSEVGEPGALADYVPVPEHRTFPGPGGEVHAHLYPPRHPEVTGPADKLPPYVVFVHGGPTSRSPMVEDLEIAFFTSRGIGVVDVNYGGSTGYGRDYRRRLNESWGVVDIDDCVAVAQALVTAGLASADRLAIRGLSAGGWTTAAALAATDVFGCGAIAAPILDLVAWQGSGTHDFEAHYLHSLVGPWPDTATRYEERSPLARADQVHAPFLLLQGDEDVICPPSQAEEFLARAAGHGVPHAHIVFAGEQHGWRQESTIAAALEAELSLYGQVFGFDPPDITRLELHP
ncbi:prolyl oligopeptidase family serine peptidase [Nocardioides sp. LHG3406-4]|uniref:prolyl oligopeptidase family serine peptidase n=1 Tax=Nocardioides sp. LHG3406-4 TaxID=2804575 RepID=UPI003CFBA0AC